MLTLSLLLALDVAVPQHQPGDARVELVYVGDDLACRHALAHLVANRVGASPLVIAWSDAAKKVEITGADLVVLAPSSAQLAVERGAFMKLMDAQIDALRKRVPRAWILLVAPDDVKQNARTWLNAIVHKRGDARMSFVIVPLAAETREQCLARMEPLVREIKARL